MQNERNTITFTNEEFFVGFTPAAIARVWTSKVNPTRKSASHLIENSPGHVSLELIFSPNADLRYYRGSYKRGTYISVGPNTTEINLLSTYDSHFVESYHEDLSGNHEGRVPEYTFVFYSLRVTEMINAFRRGVTEVLPANVNHGPPPHQNPIGALEETGDIYVNCASLVMSILKEGGWNSLIGLPEEITATGMGSGDTTATISEPGIQSFDLAKYVLQFLGFKAVKNPDTMAKLLMIAKEKDLKNVEILRLQFPNYRIKFVNTNADMLDWEAINKLDLSRIKEIKRMERFADRLSKLDEITPRKQEAETFDWRPDSQNPPSLQRLLFIWTIAGIITAVTVWVVTKPK